MAVKYSFSVVTVSVLVAELYLTLAPEYIVVENFLIATKVVLSFTLTPPQNLWLSMDTCTLWLLVSVANAVKEKTEIKSANNRVIDKAFFNITILSLFILQMYGKEFLPTITLKL